jgi:hypothetical protein
VVDRGEVSKRKKKPSKKFREEFGHTPLSINEKIPWKCSQLVIGTGAYGKLPVMKEVQREAERRKIELLMLPTAEAIEKLNHDLDDTTVLHVTLIFSGPCTLGRSPLVTLPVLSSLGNTVRRGGVHLARSQSSCSAGHAGARILSNKKG